MDLWDAPTRRVGEERQSTAMTSLEGRGGFRRTSVQYSTARRPRAHCRMLLYRTCERHERNSAHDSGTTPHSTQQFRLEYHTERETPSPETCVELTLGLPCGALINGENIFPVPECRRKKETMQKECRLMQCGPRPSAG